MGVKEFVRPYDKFVYGIIPGVLVPVLLFIFLCHKHYPYMSSLLVTVNMMYNNGMLGNHLLMSVMPSMFFVFILYKMEAFRFASGVILGAMPFLISAVFMM
jgi:hypothetical protein